MTVSWELVRICEASLPTIDASQRASSTLDADVKDA
jgi:hypothetical protein